jgi:hypothetical protein
MVFVKPPLFWSGPSFGLAVLYGVKLFPGFSTKLFVFVVGALPKKSLPPLLLAMIVLVRVSDPLLETWPEVCALPDIVQLLTVALTAIWKAPPFVSAELLVNEEFDMVAVPLVVRKAPLSWVVAMFSSKEEPKIERLA